MGNDTSRQKRTKTQTPLKCTQLLPTDNLFLKEYGIENLVFGSGGATVIAYAGAVQVLHIAGILQRIKRFTGVGTGAIVAALLAIRFESECIYDYFNAFMHNLYLDDLIGFKQISERFFKQFGWNAGENFLSWFGDLLEYKGLSPEVTFWQLYLATRIELCIVVTNVGKMCPLYCHPKTTPDMSIRQAILMSISLPGIFIPNEYKTENELCIDGSLVCNYPIHIFDGWWLSMKAKDSFLNVLDSSRTISIEKFKPRSNKTLGFLMLDKRQEHHHKELSDRLSGKFQIRIPPTILGKKHEQASHDLVTREVKYSRFRKACKELFLLAEKNADNDGTINKREFAACIFNTNQLSLQYRKLLFPNAVENKEDCLSYLEKIPDKETRLSIDCLHFHFQMQARALLNSCSDYYRTENKSLHDFFGNIGNVYKQNSLKVAKTDYERTVGIFSRYIGSNDVKMEEADQIYLYQQGWNATVVFLRQFDRTDECLLAASSLPNYQKINRADECLAAASSLPN